MTAVLGSLLPMMTLALGSLVLGSWISEPGLLRSVCVDCITMKPTTAACFVALSMALLFMRLRQPEAAVLVAGVAISLTIAVFVDGAFHLGIGLDVILAEEPIDGPGAFERGQPATVTVLAFAGIAWSIFAEAIAHRGAVRWVGGLAIAIGVAGTLGYVVPGFPLLDLGTVNPPAVHTAIGIALLGAALAMQRNGGRSS